MAALAMEISEPIVGLGHRINEIDLNAAHVLPPSSISSETGLQRYSTTFIIVGNMYIRLLSSELCAVFKV